MCTPFLDIDKRNQQALWETFLQQWMPRNYTDFENAACVTYPDGARRDEALPAPTEVNEFQSLLLQLFISGANEQRKSGRGWPNLLSEDHLMPLTSYVIIFLVLFWPYALQLSSSSFHLTICHSIFSSACFVSSLRFSPHNFKQFVIPSFSFQFFKTLTIYLCDFIMIVLFLKTLIILADPFNMQVKSW